MEKADDSDSLLQAVRKFSGRNEATWILLGCLCLSVVNRLCLFVSDSFEFMDLNSSGLHAFMEFLPHVICVIASNTVLQEWYLISFRFRQSSKAHISGLIYQYEHVFSRFGIKIFTFVMLGQLIVFSNENQFRNSILITMIFWHTVTILMTAYVFYVRVKPQVMMIDKRVSVTPSKVLSTFQNAFNIICWTQMSSLLLCVFHLTEPQSNFISQAQVFRSFGLLISWPLQFFFYHILDWGIVTYHFVAFSESIQAVEVCIMQHVVGKKKVEDHPENVLDRFLDKKRQAIERLRESKFRVIKTTANMEFFDPRKPEQQETAQQTNQIKFTGY